MLRKTKILTLPKQMLLFSILCLYDSLPVVQEIYRINPAFNSLCLSSVTCERSGMCFLLAKGTTDYLI